MLETVDKIREMIDSLKLNVERTAVAAAEARAEYAAALSVLKPAKKPRAAKRKKGEVVPVAAHARKAPAVEAPAAQA